MINQNIIDAFGLQEGQEISVARGETISIRVSIVDGLMSEDDIWVFTIAKELGIDYPRTMRVEKQFGEDTVDLTSEFTMGLYEGTYYYDIWAENLTTGKRNPLILTSKFYVTNFPNNGVSQ